MTRAEWLAGLKVGDEVAFTSASAVARTTIDRVVWASPYHVAVRGAQFSRKSGDEVTKSWFRAHINPVTDVVREQVEADRLRYAIESATRHLLGLKQLPLATLRKIAELLGVKP